MHVARLGLQQLDRASQVGVALGGFLTERVDQKGDEAGEVVKARVGVFSKGVRGALEGFEQRGVNQRESFRLWVAPGPESRHAGLAAIRLPGRGGMAVAGLYSTGSSPSPCGKAPAYAEAEMCT